MLDFACKRYMHAVCLTAPWSELTYPLSIYINAIPKVSKISTIVVVERPYKTNIYPDAFSAMSYDPRLSGPTPATSGAATLISGFCDLDAAVIERWFRDGWAHLDKGVVLLNVCFNKRFMDSDSQHEKLEFQKLLRAIIVYSVDAAHSKGVVVTMGNPAKSVVTQVLSNLGALRSKVTLRHMPNPAVLSHRKGDSASRRITKEYTGTLKFLAALVVSHPLTVSSRIPELYSLSTSTMARASEMAFNLAEQMQRALDEHRRGSALEPQTLESVMKGMIGGLQSLGTELAKLNIDAAIANSKGPPKPAQPAAYGSRSYQRPEFVRRAVTAGSASQVSVRNESSMKSVSLGSFSRDDDDEVDNPATPATPTAASSASAAHDVASPFSPGSVRAPRSEMSLSMGAFAADSDEEESTPVVASKPAPSFTVPPELSAYMRLVISYAEEELKLPRAAIKKLTDGADGKPADSRVMDISRIIGDMVREGDVSVSKVLGYEGDEPRVTHPLLVALARLRV